MPIRKTPEASLPARYPSRLNEGYTSVISMNIVAANLFAQRITNMFFQLRANLYQWLPIR